jgi:hypothetical protein
MQPPGNAGLGPHVLWSMERELVELAALADGSLTGWRRERLEGRVAASPELRAALERQRRAVESIRALDLRATPELRARIAALAD